MNKTIENVTMAKTTLTPEQIYTILETLAEKVQAATDNDKEVTVEYASPSFLKGWTPIQSIEFDGALRIEFNDGGDPLEINPNSFIGGDGLEESDIGCYCPTLRFEGITVEIECED